jgi:hypothetical protein
LSALEGCLRRFEGGQALLQFLRYIGRLTQLLPGQPMLFLFLF